MKTIQQIRHYVRALNNHAYRESLKGDGNDDFTSGANLAMQRTCQVILDYIDSEEPNAKDD